MSYYQNEQPSSSHQPVQETSQNDYKTMWEMNDPIDVDTYQPMHTESLPVITKVESMVTNVESTEPVAATDKVFTHVCNALGVESKGKSLRSIKEELRKKFKPSLLTHPNLNSPKANTCCKAIFVSQLPLWFEFSHVKTLIQLKSDFDVNWGSYYIDMFKNLYNQNTGECLIRFMDNKDCIQVFKDLQGLVFSDGPVIVNLDLDHEIANVRDCHHPNFQEQLRKFYQSGQDIVVKTETNSDEDVQYVEPKTIDFNKYVDIKIEAPENVTENVDIKIETPENVTENTNIKQECEEVFNTCEISIKEEVGDINIEENDIVRPTQDKSSTQNKQIDEKQTNFQEAYEKCLYQKCRIVHIKNLDPSKVGFFHPTLKDYIHKTINSNVNFQYRKVLNEKLGLSGDVLLMFTKHRDADVICRTINSTRDKDLHYIAAPNIKIEAVMGIGYEFKNKNFTTDLRVYQLKRKLELEGKDENLNPLRRSKRLKVDTPRSVKDSNTEERTPTVEATEVSKEQHASSGTNGESTNREKTSRQATTSEEVQCTSTETNGESRTKDKTSRTTRRVSVRQLDLLWDFLNSNKDIAFAYNRSLQAKEYSKRKWQECANTLNSQGEGAHRDWKGWCKIYSLEGDCGVQELHIERLKLPIADNLCTGIAIYVKTLLTGLYAAADARRALKLVACSILSHMFVSAAPRDARRAARRSTRPLKDFVACFIHCHTFVSAAPRDAQAALNLVARPSTRSEYPTGVVEVDERDFSAFGLSKEFMHSLGVKMPFSRTVTVSNLHPDIDEAKLMEVFSLAGEVKKIDYTPSERKAKIEYDHALEAVQALSMLDRQKLYNMTMNVRMNEVPRRKVLPQGLAGVGQGLGKHGQPLRGCRVQAELRRLYEFFVDLGKMEREDSDKTNPFKFKFNPIKPKDMKRDSKSDRNRETNVGRESNRESRETNVGRESNRESSNKSSNSDFRNRVYSSSKPSNRSSSPSSSKSTESSSKDANKSSKSGESVPEGTLLAIQALGTVLVAQGLIPADTDCKSLQSILGALQKKTAAQQNLQKTNMDQAQNRTEALNQALSTVIQFMSSNPQQPNVAPISTPVQPLPMPIQPVPMPVQSVPTPVPMPVQPVPTPVQPVPTPVQPVPTPVQPVPRPTVQNPVQSKWDIAGRTGNPVVPTLPTPVRNRMPAVPTPVKPFEPRVAFAMPARPTNAPQNKSVQPAYDSVRSNLRAVPTTVPTVAKSGPVKQTVPTTPKPVPIHQQKNSVASQQKPENVIASKDKAASQTGVNLEKDIELHESFKKSEMLVFKHLPACVTTSVLQSKMREVGEVKFCEMTGRGRAFVRFKNPKDADRCIRLFHLSKVDGQVIQVSFL